MATTEVNEASNGWPLGLEIMNKRLRAVESLKATPTEPNSLRILSTSFSCLSSSNLDTESTASFFQDHSVPLGRLIGIRPGDGGLYFPRRIHQDRGEGISVMTVRPPVSKRCRVDMSPGICIPLLLGTLEKMSRCKSKPKQQ